MIRTSRAQSSGIESAWERGRPPLIAVCGRDARALVLSQTLNGRRSYAASWNLENAKAPG